MGDVRRTLRMVGCTRSTTLFDCGRPGQIRVCWRGAWQAGPRRCGWSEYGTLDTPVEYLCAVARAQARWLGDGELGWDVADWREWVAASIGMNGESPGALRLGSDRVLLPKVVSDHRRGEFSHMTAKVTLQTVCAPSGDVVAREIEGEVIIVPLIAGIGDADDELYTLNETGQAIWKRLDGHATLGEVAAGLAEEFETPPEEVEADVLGFAAELVQRGILAAAE